MGKDRSYLLRTYAKINLCLDVLFKRPDGFHEIDSLFQNISLHDDLEVRLVHGQGRIFVESNVKIDGNILLKVWDLVKSSELDCYVRLEKKIPMGAGLGGGSSNAGGFLALLATHGLISWKKATQIAPLVGSDVPFFLCGGTAIVGGRGERLTHVAPLLGYKLDVIKPDYSISTKEAYAKLRPELFGKAPLKASQLYEAFKSRDWQAIKLGAYNVFEYIVPKELKQEIEAFRKEYPAALTGSGSAYFVLRDGGNYEFVQKAWEVES